MQFVDHQILYALRWNAASREFSGPERFRFDESLLLKAGVFEILRHTVRIGNHRTAYCTVELRKYPCKMRAARIRPAAPSLIARIDVGFVGDLTLLVGDAEHIGALKVIFEAGQIGLPDAASDRSKWNRTV